MELNINFANYEMTHCMVFALTTYVLRLIIALGIPVGVLNAGSNLSATWTALVLKTYKKTQTQLNPWNH